MSHESRIDIQGQHGLCDGDGVKVSRTMPALLNGHMTDIQWNQLCDRLDEALQPLAKAKRIQVILSGITASLFVLFMIIPILMYSNVDADTNFDKWFILFLVGPLVLILGSVAANMWNKKHTASARNALTAVCEEESRKSPQMSFHVRFEYAGHSSFRNNRHHHTITAYNYVSLHTRYKSLLVSAIGAFTHSWRQIEVSVASTAVPAQATIVPTSVWSDPEYAISGATGKSSADRLGELETIRSYLTEEEYQRTRQEILASI